MKRALPLLLVLAAYVVLCGYANEPHGFLDDPWGYKINQWLKDNPGARKVADDAGFAWYAPDRRVSLAGIGVEARYGFWKEKLTEVKLTFPESSAPRVKEYLYGRFGEVADNGNLVYTWFGYTTEIFLNAMENELRFVSHELGQKAENRIRKDLPTPAAEQKTGDKAKKKGKKK